jgi:hypothetical protein
MLAEARCNDPSPRGIEQFIGVLLPLRRRLDRRVAAIGVLGVAAVTVVAALTVVALNHDDGRRKAVYLTYRSAQERRGPAEERLREAFSDLDAAADTRDRRAALAAIARGREASSEIDILLADEIEAAAALGRFGDIAREARRLEKALTTSRSGLALLVRTLEIGRRDPFLEDSGNQSEVDRLAREAATFSVDGEFARRRAQRALALTIGVEPTFDVLFDVGAKTTAPSG